MKKRYYAVRVGEKPGIYQSWDEARIHVDGFRGAEFKGFPTYQEAEAFMESTKPFYAKKKKKKRRLYDFGGGKMTHRTVGLDEPFYQGEAPPWDL